MNISELRGQQRLDCPQNIQTGDTLSHPLLQYRRGRVGGRVEPCGKTAQRGFRVTAGQEEQRKEHVHDVLMAKCVS